MKPRILFLEAVENNRACMAAAFARRQAQGCAEIFCAALCPGPSDAAAETVMGEVGLSLAPETPLSVDGLYRQRFDIVILLSAQAEADCPLLPGRPAVLRWPLDDANANADAPANAETVNRDLRDRIAALVEPLFNHGYLDAFVAMRNTETLILDSISDGILAHDAQRRIVFFNQAAETITGMPRERVLGRDCHEVFDGRFCGGKCVFCDPPAALPDDHRHEIDFVNAAGDSRTLEAHVKPLRTRLNRQVGVVVSFCDRTREQELARRCSDIDCFAGIIGRDAQMQSVYTLIKDVARANIPVLIEGESGTGKELVAAAIHNESPRANRLFVPVNCGALPEGILESELFGHVKGAFTGAVRDKKGRFELADGGTIFLDEIGDIPPAMQVRLLRVLQEGTFERVGGEQTLKVDVRLVSATNRDLRDEITAGRFREDLFYRLNVMPIRLPPLRERRTDIPLLAMHFLKRFAADMDRANLSFAEDALDRLMDYDWPGNVRELQNWIQYALIKCHSERIEATHLPPPLVNPARPNVPQGSQPVHFPRARGGRRLLSPESVQEALEGSKGNRVEAARRLGVSRATLYRFFADHPEALA